MSEPTHEETTSSAQVAADYTIDTYKVSVLSAQYNRTGSAQVPFILATPGPISLRSRNNAPIIDSGDKKN